MTEKELRERMEVRNYMKSVEKEVINIINEARKGNDMLPKPSVLKGEVKEFIDLAWLYEDGEDLFDIRLFYQQPFSPEMITEYFQGWEQNRDYELQYDNDEQGDHMWLSNRKVFVHKTHSYAFTLKITTLSQAIIFIKSANINLTWKE